MFVVVITDVIIFSIGEGGSICVLVLLNFEPKKLGSKFVYSTY